MELDDLSQPGAVEALIQDGRVPAHFGTLIIGNEEPQMSFWVPPLGIKKGDKVVGSPLVGFYFKSPEGLDRGAAEMYIVPVEVGKQIMDRVKTVLEGIKK